MGFDWYNPGSYLGLTYGGGSEGDSETRVENSMPYQLPEFPEADLSRKTWSDTLQKWSTQPGYGAIQPNWSDIWNNARQKVQRYFMGGPEGPGAIASVKANLARRGASEDPAAEASLGRLFMQQGNNLSDIATQMAGKEADLSEQGRRDWLTSITNLSNLRPQFTGYPMSSTTTRQTIPQSMGQILGDSATSLLSNVAGTGGTGFDWLDQILGMNGGGGDMSTDILSQLMGGGESGASSIGDMSSIFGGGGGGAGGSNGLFGLLQGEDFGDVMSDPATWQQIMQIVAMA